MKQSFQECPGQSSRVSKECLPHSILSSCLNIHTPNPASYYPWIKTWPSNLSLIHLTAFFYSFPWGIYFPTSCFILLLSSSNYLQRVVKPISSLSFLERDFWDAHCFLAPAQSETVSSVRWGMLSAEKLFVPCYFLSGPRMFPSFSSTAWPQGHHTDMEGLLWDPALGNPKQDLCRLTNRLASSGACSVTMDSLVPARLLITTATVTGSDLLILFPVIDLAYLFAQTGLATWSLGQACLQVSLLWGTWAYLSGSHYQYLHGQPALPSP